MKAWTVYTVNDDGMILIHADTAGKAKWLGFRALPWFGTEFTGMRVRRCKELDDKPFTIESVSAAEVYDIESIDDPLSEWWSNECTCEICQL